MSHIPKGHTKSLDVDIDQNNNAIVITMHIAGIDHDNVAVEIEEGQLHVFGESNHKTEMSRKNCSDKEAEYGRFDRLISLPPGIDKSGMQYEINNGVLTVMIPKK
jgi:HSP20 family protein